MNRVQRIVCSTIITASTCLSTSAFSAEEKLPSFNALSDQTSISGLSSGAFMSAQFHIAYSKDLVGVGIVAGGPWNCAQTNPSFALAPVYNAVSSCMNPCDPMPPFNNIMVTGVSCPFGTPKYPDADYLVTLAKNNVTLGYIDDTANVLDDKIYLFSGQSDETVQTGVVTTAVDFYKKLGVDETRIFYNKSVDAGHAFITDDNADTPCDETKAPYINYCNINQSYRILNQIYGSLNDPAPQTTGKLITFDQSEFFNSLLYPNVSMDDKAYVYVPEACESEQCRVHVAMHGCEQGTQSLGLEYVTETGYNNVADTNNIIVLYPQAKKSALNPKGCWDFWGYSNNNLPPFTYFTKSAPQMAAIKAMIDRVSQPK